MLEELDKIDWSKYQALVDIPQLIRDLASDNDEVWKNASYELSDRVLMVRLILGTGPTEYIYEVLGTDLLRTMAPFLVELLKYPNIKSKPAILDLLDAMVSYREFSLVEPFQSRANEIPLHICPGVATLITLLDEVQDYFDQTKVIRLLEICALEVCDSDERSRIFEVLVEYIDSSLSPDTLEYLLATLNEAFEKVEISTDLRSKYDKKLNSL